MMIDKDDMTTLIPASTAKSQAGAALATHEEASVAFEINNAVNTGEYSVRINHELSSTLMTKLTGSSYNYKVEPVRDAYQEIVPGQYIIRWD